MTPQVTPELKKVQEQHNQVLALKGVLQTVDRALSGVGDLKVKIVPNPTYGSNPAPAWTDGKDISLDQERVFKVFEEQDLPTAILTFKGTNFHELAHVLFTPRKDDEIGKWIKSTRYKYKWCWNALEDQRIETLYTALYPPTVPYFRNSSYRWLLEDTVGNDKFYRVYSLIGGRKYIDRGVRRQARQAFVDHYGPEVADQLDDVVNEYVALPLPGSQDRAIELVEEFYNLLSGTDLRDYLDNQDSCGGQGASESGEVDPEKVIEATVRVREQQDREAKQDEKDGHQERREQPQAAPSAGGYPEDDEDEDDEQQDSAPASSGGYPEDDEDSEDPDEDLDDDHDDFPWETDENADEPWEDEDASEGDSDSDSDSDDEDEDGQDGSDGDQGDSDSEGGQEGPEAGDSASDADQDGDTAEGDADGDSDQENGDGPEGETKADGKSGESAGAGSTEQAPPDPAKDLQEAISEALADTLTDEALQEDIDRTVAAFKANAAGKGEAETQPEYTRYTDEDAQDATIATVQRIVSQLRLIKTDAEATWIRERQQGSRVNINHAIRHAADPTHLEVFEEWDEGYEEEAKTEVVIAIDLSISMDDVLPQCSEALWALKKAFDNVDVPTTVLGFSAGNVVLYDKAQKLRGLKLRRFQQWSGTVPRDTFLYAHRLFARSTATNKVLIVITDGVWQGQEDDGCDPVNVVADLRRRGATTLLLGVNGHRATDRTYGFEQCADLTEIGDIVKVARGLVTNIQQNAGRNKR